MLADEPFRKNHSSALRDTTESWWVHNAVQGYHRSSSVVSSVPLSRHSKCSFSPQFPYLNGPLLLFNYNLAFCVTEEIRCNTHIRYKNLLASYHGHRQIYPHGDDCGPPPFTLPSLLCAWEAAPSLPITILLGPLASREFG